MYAFRHCEKHLTDVLTNENEQLSAVRLECAGLSWSRNEVAAHFILTLMMLQKKFHSRCGKKLGVWNTNSRFNYSIDWKGC